MALSHSEYDKMRLEMSCGIGNHNTHAIYNGHETAGASPVRSPEVMVALDVLEKQVAQLNDMTKVLSQRLEAVKRPIPEVNVASQPPPHQYTSPVARRIEEITETVQRLIGVQATQLDLLEV